MDKFTKVLVISLIVVFSLVAIFGGTNTQQNNLNYNNLGKSNTCGICLTSVIPQSNNLYFDSINDSDFCGILLSV